MTSKIIDLSYTIKKYRELKPMVTKLIKLMDVWNVLIYEQLMDTNGQPINKDGDYCCSKFGQR